MHIKRTTFAMQGLSSFIILLLCTTGLNADDRFQTAFVAAMSELTSQLQTGKADFTPITSGQLATAKSELATSVNELDRFISSGKPDNAERWRKYLLWDKLMAQLAGDVQPDANELGRVAAKFYSGYRGLELPPFVKVRENLLAYRLLVQSQSASSIDTLYEQQIDALTADMQDAAVETSAEKYPEIVSRLSWLEQLGQMPNVVSRIRQRFGHPNLQVSVSETFIADGFSDQISESTRVSENILGTRVTGVAHTTGVVSANVVPNPNTATIEVMLNGQTISDTVGHRSPVRIYNSGVTSVFGHKVILIDDMGIRSQPATAQCSTKTRLKRIATDRNLGSRMIKRIAQKRVQQQKASAERICARKAERRVTRMMDERSLGMIAENNTRIDQKLRLPLRKRDLYPRWVHMSTTDDRLILTALQGRSAQLAAPSAPPAMPEHALCVQVHETLFLNTGVNAIGGLLVTDERAAELVKEVTGEVPEELEIKQDEDPWSIGFDRQQPISVAFQDGLLKIAIRGRRFTRADQVVRQTIQIGGTYSIEIIDGRVRLVRQGDVEVSYPEKEEERLSLSELRNKTFMTGKFEGLFKKVIEGEGVDLPEGWEGFGSRQLSYASADNGWLSLGWN